MQSPRSDVGSPRGLAPQQVSAHLQVTELMDPKSPFFKKPIKPISAESKDRGSAPFRPLDHARHHAQSNNVSRPGSPKPTPPALQEKEVEKARLARPPTSPGPSMALSSPAAGTAGAADRTAAAAERTRSRGASPRRAAASTSASTSTSRRSTPPRPRPRAASVVASPPASSSNLLTVSADQDMPFAVGPARGAFRQWVNDHTSREEPASDKVADTVTGVWTCCRSIDPRHLGCKSSGTHGTEHMQCLQCGTWVHRDDESRFSLCVHHTGEAKANRWGAVEWTCCGDLGLEGTKYDYYGDHVDADKRRRHATSGCTKGNHLLPYLVDCEGCHEKLWPGTAQCLTCGYIQQEAAADDQMCTRCAWREADVCAFHPGVWCPERRLRWTTHQKNIYGCCNRPHGCTVILPAKKMPEHEMICPKTPMACPNGCQITILREGIAAHLKVCPLARIACPHGCGRQMARGDLVAHEAMCPRFKVPCTLGCDALVPREGALAHSRVCPHRLVACARCKRDNRACDVGSHPPFCLVPCTLGCGAALTADDEVPHLEVCPNRPGVCPWCATKAAAKALPDHLRACPKRPRPCEFGCGEMVQYACRDAHRKACAALVVVCPLACGASLHSDAVDAHMANDCSNATVVCGDCSAHVRRVKAIFSAERQTWLCDACVEAGALLCSVCADDEGSSEPRTRSAELTRSRPSSAGPRRPAGAHAWPVCNGYCLHRSELQGAASGRVNGLLEVPGQASGRGRGRRTPSRKGSKPRAKSQGRLSRPASAAELPAGRRSWMMMAPVSVHWKGNSTPSPALLQDGSMCWMPKKPQGAQGKVGVAAPFSADHADR